LNLFDVALKVHLKYSGFQGAPSNKPQEKLDVPTYILGNRLMSKNEWYRRYNSSLSEYLGSEAERVRNQYTKPTHKILGGKLKSPEISVLISLYKSDEFLNYLLDSLSLQTISLETEFIFLLVQPSIPVRRGVLEFIQTHPLSKVLEFRERNGIYEAWNEGIKIATAEFITNWNADDTRSPSSLEIQVQYLRKYGWVDVVYQDVFYSFEPTTPWEIYKRIGMRSNLHSVSARYLLETGMNPPHNAPAWRKTLHDSIGLFSETYKSAGDYEFWIRVSLNNGKFFKIPDATVGYFINPKGISTTPGGPGLQETHKIRSEYLERLDVELKSADLKEIREVVKSFNKSADDITAQYVDLYKIPGSDNK